MKRNEAVRIANKDPPEDGFLDHAQTCVKRTVVLGAVSATTIQEFRNKKDDP